VQGFFLLSRYIWFFAVPSSFVNKEGNVMRKTKGNLIRWKSILLFAMPALIVIMVSGQAGAAGFQLFEENAAGIGNAYAGSAASAENASTIFFNPAGMTRLQEREISAGVTAVRPSFKFNNNGTTHPGSSANDTDGGDGGDWNYVPNASLSYALTKDFYVGVGFSVPFGLATEYSSDWSGRYQSVKFSIETLNVNPSIAFRVSDKLSLGFGINWQKLKAEYVRHAHPALGQVTLNADDDAWGWNAGALLQLSPATRIGLSYRSSMQFTIDGNLTGAAGLGLPQPAKADIKLPDTAILSMVQGLSDRWELLGDISLTRWSCVDKVDVFIPVSSTPAQTLKTQFNDSWRAAVGANYKASDAWKIRMGVAYDKTPVPDAEHRMVSLPDNDRIAFGLGVQWKPTKSSAVDVGGQYLYMKSPDIYNEQTAEGRGLVKGTFDDKAYLIGVQYSIGF
jgi:long-chain fatty acid transport protein